MKEGLESCPLVVSTCKSSCASHNDTSTQSWGYKEPSLIHKSWAAKAHPDVTLKDSVTLVKKGTGVVPLYLAFETTGLAPDLVSMLVFACVTSCIARWGYRMWHGWVLLRRASTSCECWVSTCQLLRWTSNPSESTGFYQWGGFKAYSFPSLQITLPLFRLKYQNLMVCRISAKKSIISEAAKIIAPIDQIGRMVCPPAEVRKDKGWRFLKHAWFAEIE